MMGKTTMKRASRGYSSILEISTALLLLVAIFMPQAAYAHRLNLFVSEGEIEGDDAGSHGGEGIPALYVEGYFADGSPAMRSRVRVLDRNGELLAEAVTDEQGVAEIKLPPDKVKGLKAEGGPVKIELVASLGHRAEISYLPDWSRWGKAEGGITEGTGSRHLHRHPIGASKLLREAALGTGLIVLFFLGLYCIRKIHAIQGQMEG